MKAQLNCENKLQSIANNFKDMGNALYLMGILDGLESELTGKKDAVSIAMMRAIKNKLPAKDIISEVNGMLHDGWDGISPELANKILKLKLIQC